MGEAGVFFALPDNDKGCKETSRQFTMDGEFPLYNKLLGRDNRCINNSPRNESQGGFHAGERYYWAICSASPELFLRIDGEQIESRPMKGTAARGLWFEDDQTKKETLMCSEKERAEKH